jgi:transposase-like protein
MEEYFEGPSVISEEPAAEFVRGFVELVSKWSYLYRAVDSTGETIDFVLSPNRELIAAKLFLRPALSGASGV